MIVCVRRVDEYETQFLKRDVQGEIVARTLSPTNWPSLGSTAWGRSELAAQFYDEILFKGATFGDLNRGDGPMILASATDLATGSRFVFSQSTFDVICSDLNAVSLSRAASASSAVPVVLSAVTLNNYGGTCNFRVPPWAAPFIDSADPPRPAAQAIRTLKSVRAYGDSVNRPFLHLVDGGVADNLGMRGVLDTLEILEALREAGLATPFDNVRRIFVFSVNSISESTNELGNVRGPAGYRRHPAQSCGLADRPELIRNCRTAAGHGSEVAHDAHDRELQGNGVQYRSRRGQGAARSERRDLRDRRVVQRPHRQGGIRLSESTTHIIRATARSGRSPARCGGENHPGVSRIQSTAEGHRRQGSRQPEVKRHRVEYARGEGRGCRTSASPATDGDLLLARTLSPNNRLFRRCAERLHALVRNYVPTKAFLLAALAVCVLLADGTTVHGQSIEPRSYSNAPVGVNFLIGGYAYTRGGLAFDSSLPITDPSLATSSAVLGYARVLDLWGKSGKFDVIVPYTWLSGSADYRGSTVERMVSGFADPMFRLSVNFYGAPALTLPEFKSYEQDLIVGGSLQVSAPTGQYDDTKVVNIGTHRWYFKPEIGVSKALGQWTLEGAAAVMLFTTNNDFYNGNRRSQDPLYSFRAHAIYSFPYGIWGSVDGTYFAGGRTTLNGTLDADLQQNWRVGGTLAFPVDVYNSVKLYASKGVSARTGNNYDLAGVAWQYRWGGGL